MTLINAPKAIRKIDGEGYRMGSEAAFHYLGGKTG
jgi:hypothetical protein